MTTEASVEIGVHRGWPALVVSAASPSRWAPGLLWPRRSRGVEGRLAYFALGSVCGTGLELYGWYRLRRWRVEMDMPHDAVAVQSQLLGNASDRPVTLMKHQDCVDGGHAEQVRNACPPAAGSAEGYTPNRPPQGGLF